jgi:hypothetical protein
MCYQLKGIFPIKLDTREYTENTCHDIQLKQDLCFLQKAPRSFHDSTHFNYNHLYKRSMPMVFIKKGWVT